MQNDNMKYIPRGIGDFFSLKNENYYYVDKTNYIEVLEETRLKYIFFLRPRRFGKTLLISTLANYYDVNKKDTFDKIFNETYIKDNPTPLKNSYYILRFDFSKIGTSESLEKIERAFNKSIYNSIEKFYSDYKDVIANDSEFLNAYTALDSAFSLIDVFCTKMSNRNLKLYVLIDEYDNFANNLLMDKGEEDYLSITHGTGFFRSFFTAIKAGTSSCIDRFFITGVSQLVLSDVTSGMNIGSNISFRNDFNSMTGFNDKDVEEILEYYISFDKIKREDKEEIKKIFKAYYNNYCFSENFEERVHNPNMVLYFLDAYMSRKRIPSELIESSFATDYRKLEYLVIKNKQISDNFDILQEVMTNGEVASELVESFPIREIENSSEFVSLLYYLGLLTVKERAGLVKYKFCIPNLAIKKIVYGYMTRALNEVFEVKNSFIYELQNAFDKMAINGEWEKALNLCIESYYNKTSVRDTNGKELALKMFVLAYLSFDAYHVAQSEPELNRGYADIYLKSSILGEAYTKYEYLFEFKYIKSEDTENEERLQKTINEKLEMAKAQLKKYEESGMLEEAKKAGREVKKIVIIGSSKKLEYMSQVE